MTIKQTKGVLPGTIKGFAWVRDIRTGMPRADNPQMVPKHEWDKLTEEEKNYVNSAVSPELRRYD